MVYFILFLFEHENRPMNDKEAMHVGNMVIPAHITLGGCSYYQRVVKYGTFLTKQFCFIKVQKLTVLLK